MEHVILPKVEKDEVVIIIPPDNIGDQSSFASRLEEFLKQEDGQGVIALSKEFKVWVCKKEQVVIIKDPVSIKEFIKQWDLVIHEEQEKLPKVVQ